MRKILFCCVALMTGNLFGQSIIWSDDFENPSLWTINVPSGLNEIDANLWVISDAEGGVAPGNCGVASNGNKTLHVGCQGTWCIGSGAIYNTGDGGLGFIYATTNKRAIYANTISTVGYSNLNLKFDWIGVGQLNTDYATVIYSIDNGLTWSDLSAISGGSTCPNSQGLWQQSSINLPAQCLGINNLKIGFNWTNNNDAVGSDPSFAVNNIRIEAPSAPNASINLSGSSFICAGECIGFTNTTVGATNYSWDFGNGTVSNTMNPPLVCYPVAGNYTIQMIACNAIDCDTAYAAITVRESPQTGLNFSNGVLTSLQTNAFYQWILCPLNTPVPGANAMSYTPTINAQYAVIVTLSNGCTDTSACVVVDDLSISESENEHVNIYPNPSEGTFTFLLPLASSPISIFDLNGRLVVESIIHHSEPITFELPAGSYFAILSELDTKPLKLIIE
jgi:PKD repeat protein